MTSANLNTYPKVQYDLAKQQAASGERIGCRIRGALRVYGDEVRGVKETYDVPGSCGRYFTEDTVALCDSCRSYAGELVSAMGKYYSPDNGNYCGIQIERIDPYADLEESEPLANASDSENHIVLDMSVAPEPEAKQESWGQLGLRFIKENKKTLTACAALAVTGVGMYVAKRMYFDANQPSNPNTPSDQDMISLDTDLPTCSAKATRAERESCIAETLDNFYTESSRVRDAVIGYPEATDFHAEEVKKFLEFSLNNCGNWEEKTNYPLTSFKFEKQVMEHFADLFGTDLTESWGYVTNGGTDGNLWGCYLAREHFGDNSTLFYTDSAHYSVSKLIRMLKLNACEVKSTSTGEMNYTDFASKVAQQKSSNPHVKPIVFNTIGTTLTGAVDNITEVQNILFEHGFSKEQFHIHADAALSGLILPYVDNPQAFKFSDGVDSLSVSGHKMLGSPIPCGIALARRDLVKGISKTVDYIAANDLTIAGSRNGLTPLHIWQEMSRTSHDEKVARVTECLTAAESVVQQLQEAGINAWRHENSVTVVFPSPSESVWRKHKLASAGGKTHIIVAGYNEGVKEFLDLAVSDIIADHKKNN